MSCPKFCQPPIEVHLQHGDNEDPITYVNSKDAEDILHEDDLEHDENEEPVTFVDEIENKN